MPYAQAHFPFENKKEFEESFPADFIAEGIDQTRGWFYTLLVISTALFNKPPFKNLIVNGLVLANDGQKMSKRLKNYPDPMEVVNKYGADALRLFLINSPVVKAENLKFREEGVLAILKDVFLPWYNAYRFLFQNVERYEREEKTVFSWNEASFFCMHFCESGVIYSGSRSSDDFLKSSVSRGKLPEPSLNILNMLENFTKIAYNRSRRRIDQLLSLYWNILLYRYFLYS